jgi:hypothetical protein
VYKSCIETAHLHPFEITVENTLYFLLFSTWWAQNKTLHTGADPGISGGGDDMDEEKIGRGLGAAVGPQRGPGAEPLVGVKGRAKPPTKVKLFSRIIQ